MSAVGWNEITQAMLDKLNPLVLGPQPPPAGAYLRVLDWYAGEFSSREAYEQSGVSGRTPAALVDFLSDKVIRTMAAGRRQFIESTFAVVCVSDSMRSMQDRQTVALDRVVFDVRKTLSNVRLPVACSPLRYAGLQLVAKEPRLFSYACRFTTRHHIDSSTSAAGLPQLRNIVGLIRQVGGSGEVPIVLELPEEP